MWFGTGNVDICSEKMDESRSDEEFNDGMDCGKVMEGRDVDEEIVASGGGEGATDEP